MATSGFSPNSLTVQGEEASLGMKSPMPHIAIKHSTAAKCLGTREPPLEKVRKGWYFHTFSFRVTKSCLQQLAAFPITWQKLANYM